MVDYHVHTHFSADSHERIETYIKKAPECEISEICFTDHYDLDYSEPSQSTGKSWEADIGAACAAIETAAANSPVRLLHGIEMGLRLEGDIQERSVAHLSQFPLDYIIASVHLVDGKDPWYPSYFDGITRAEGYRRYLEIIYECVKKTDQYSAIGHIDYPVKGCPYEEKVLRYTDAPDLLDDLFRHIISQGKCIEINGSVLAKLGNEIPDLAIYRRYVALGGEFVTLGSDAHCAKNLGQCLHDARDFAETAGIRYIATYAAQEPQFHPISRCP